MASNCKNPVCHNWTTAEQTFSEGLSKAIIRARGASTIEFDAGGNTLLMAAGEYIELGPDVSGRNVTIGGAAVDVLEFFRGLD